MKTLLLLLLTLTAGTAHAQSTLEYPGGPTSKMSQADLDRISQWTVQARDQLQRLENDVRMMSDELAIRDKLYSKLKLIAGSTGLRPGDLLLRQALYTGVMMVDIIERQANLKIQAGRGKVAGTVAKESMILKKVLKMAKDDYYVSDQRYIQGALQSRGAVYFNDKLVEFGLRMAKFIYDRSIDVQMVSAIASYGMLREALGILNRKMFEDDRNVAFKSQILELVDRLSEFPEMESMTDDVEATLLLSGTDNKPGLRWVAKNMFDEVVQVQKDILE